MYRQFFEHLFDMKKKDINEEELGINPFVGPLSIPVRKMTSRDFKEDGSPVFRTYDWELTQSTKFYLNSEVRRGLSRLSGTGSQLLLWVMQKLENGKDYIWISRETCMRELGINSTNTYRAAVKSLCDGSFLAPIFMMPDVYFINPQVFFNGNRAKRFHDKTEEYVPKKQEELNED